jgi:ferric-dicitrate binding protein FerR (iron transport regulator)
MKLQRPPEHDARPASGFMVRPTRPASRSRERGLVLLVCAAACLAGAVSGIQFLMFVGDKL